MKFFLLFYFIFVGMAFTSAWILFERAPPRSVAPILFRREAAALNLPMIHNTGIRRPTSYDEIPRICRFKGVCSPVDYRDHSDYRGLLEAKPIFKSTYDNVRSRRMKGRQSYQPRRAYLARNSVIYMSPDVMIVRPAGTSHEWLPPRKYLPQNLPEGFISKPTKFLQPEIQKTENQAMFQAFPDRPKISENETLPSGENRRTFEVSSERSSINSTSESSLRDTRPSSVQPYAVKEIIDEKPVKNEGTAGKNISVPKLKEEIPADVRRSTTPNSRIVKIIPSERNDNTGKKSEKKTGSNYPTTTDHFLQIIPSHRSRGFNKTLKEHPVNRQEKTKNLKIVPNWQHKPVEARTDNRPRVPLTPKSSSEVENRVTEATTYSAFDIPREDTTVESSPKKINYKGAPTLPIEKEFTSYSKQPKDGKQAVAPSKVEPTPIEVTFMMQDMVNVTDVPEDYTVTWKFQNDASPTPREILNTIGYITSKNPTTTEDITDRPYSFDLLTVKSDLKKDQEFWKNSRKMHFGQNTGPNEILDPVDQRRSDILITDNFDDYIDEDYNLSYLEKLKRNNSLGNPSSDSLIPLIPMVIQDLRHDKIPKEDISLLSKAFGDLWATVLELSNSTNLDMLPLLKMKDESDLKNILQSIRPQVAEPTTKGTSVASDGDYDSYDYMEKFKDLYEDLLIVGQELEGDEEKRLEKRVKGWKRSGIVSK